MKSLEPVISKKTSKDERERRVLVGLVELYLETGKPVGSKTLQETGFSDLSSATIRNYFADLEKKGFVMQPHVSGGRVPTNEAFRFYANEYAKSHLIEPECEEFDSIRKTETEEIAGFLQKSAETLSSLTQHAVFLSAPRFDHDFISSIKLVPVDYTRFLCVVITDFGVIKTELFHIDKRLSAFSIKRMEAYFHWRLTGHDEPENLTEEEREVAQHFYNELMVRYIVGYSTFIDEEVYRTGFSKLLSYPEFHDTTVLANSLALFENAHSMRLILRECSSLNELKVWIGKDLSTYAVIKPNCSVIAIPYYINKQPVGAVGLIGPTRMTYRELFGMMQAFSDSLSEALTNNIYKFKINFRQPQDDQLYLQKEEHQILGQSRLMLLEDKRKGESCR